jgi:hypothetical protein
MTLTQLRGLMRRDSVAYWAMGRRRRPKTCMQVPRAGRKGKNLRMAHCHHLDC